MLARPERDRLVAEDGGHKRLRRRRKRCAQYLWEFSNFVKAKIFNMMLVPLAAAAWETVLRE